MLQIAVRMGFKLLAANPKPANGGCGLNELLLSFSRDNL